MVLAKGSKFTIGKYTGALSEDYSVRLESEFGAIVDDFQSSGIWQAITVAGATAKSVSGGKIGFSSHYKQFGTQVWKGSSPASVSVGVTFDRTSNAKDDIMGLVRELCAFPLPAENGALGSLVPPGPSLVEAIGLDELKEKDFGAAAGDAYVNFTIGKMEFNRYLMTSAEPTFNRFSDDSDYPISVTIQFEFISLWTATKNTPLGW
jgi:hypothetical protein